MWFDGALYNEIRLSTQPAHGTLAVVRPVLHCDPHLSVPSVEVLTLYLRSLSWIS